MQTVAKIIDTYDRPSGLAGRALATLGYTLCLSLCVLTINVMAAPSIYAQSRGASYLPAFPDGDAYNVLVIGDDFSYGLRHGLADSIGALPRLKLQPRPLHFAGILRVNMAKQIKRIESALAESNISIVVMMVGARDAVAIRNQKGKRFGVATEVWNKEYVRRVDQLDGVGLRKSLLLCTGWECRSPPVHAATKVIAR